MSNQTSNQTAPGDTSGGAVIYTDNGNSYLNREVFDFKKHKQINNDLFWRAFNLGIFLILSIFITGYSSYYIEEYRKKENYESWIYYILYVFLIISLVSILLIILLFAIIPYSKIRGVLLLVKSMTNIYGADYADPEIHNSMGTILGKNESQGQEITNYLQKNYANVPSEIIRSVNRGLYNDMPYYPSAPIQQVTDANGNKTDIAAVKTPVPAAASGTASGTAPGSSGIYENPRLEETSPDDITIRGSESPISRPSSSMPSPVRVNPETGERQKIYEN